MTRPVRLEPEAEEEIAAASTERKRPGPVRSCSTRSRTTILAFRTWSRVQALHSVPPGLGIPAKAPWTGFRTRSSSSKLPRRSALSPWRTEPVAPATGGGDSARPTSRSDKRCECAPNGARRWLLRECYDQSVRAARARVVKGKIVTRAKFPEGARLTILMDDDRPPIELEPEDEDAMLRGIDSIKAGKGVPLDEFREILRRA